MGVWIWRRNGTMTKQLQFSLISSVFTCYVNIATYLGYLTVTAWNYLLCNNYSWLKALLKDFSRKNFWWKQPKVKIVVLLCELFGPHCYMILVLWNTLHVGLVVVADLLDTDVVLGLDVGLGGGVGSSQCHHTYDVLEVLLVFNFDLLERVHLLVSSQLKIAASTLAVTT